MLKHFMFKLFNNNAFEQNDNPKSKKNKPNIENLQTKKSKFNSNTIGEYVDYEELKK